MRSFRIPEYDGSVLKVISLLHNCELHHRRSSSIPPKILLQVDHELSEHPKQLNLRGAEPAQNC